jgi:hypothetical protein
MNTIAESKTTDLVVQVSEMDEHIIKGQVLLGDKYNEIGKISYWSTSTFNISSNKQKEDAIVLEVVNKFKNRSEIGIKKYGTTLEDNQLSLGEWINHAIEEQMDNILYLTKLKNELKKKDIN